MSEPADTRSDAEIAYARYADLMVAPPWEDLTDRMRYAWRAAIAALDLERARRAP